MPNVFQFHDYRDFIRAILLPQPTGRRTQASIARGMGCQAAYFSQVLRGKAEITEDHALGLCSLLALDPTETEFFLVLVRHRRAATPMLRSHLESRRKQIAEQRRELGNRISSRMLNGDQEATRYYCSSWIPAAIHSATNCASLQEAVQIAKRFSLPETDVRRHLKTLLDFGFVRQEKGKWIFQGGSIHIAKSSADDLAFQTHRRLQVLGHLARRRDDDVHYANVVSIDAKSAETLRARIISFLEKAHRIAEASPSSDVYSLCLDFFRI